LLINGLYIVYTGSWLGRIAIVKLKHVCQTRQAN